MNYRLINRQTKEEYLCEKVVIDRFDYYVSDTYINKLNPDDKYHTIVENSRRVVQYSKHIQSKDIVVICTNNPNIDIPKVVNEVNERGKKYALQYCDEIETGIFINRKQGFIEGYTHSQSTHPNSDEDMIEFGEWLGLNYVRLHKVWVHRYASQIDKDMWIETDKLLTIWKDQRVQTIYFN